jgi:Lipase (class 3)
VVSVDNGKNSPTGDPNGPDGEVMLDIEVVGSIASGANIVVYFAPNTDAGFLDAVTTAIHDATNKPSVLSISWGGPESNWTGQAMSAMDSAFQAAAAMGITVCVASGDNGSSDGDTDGSAHVDFPASSPYALACGGTRLNASLSAVESETVWNDGPAGGASGGGVSGFFVTPVWQAGAAVKRGLNASLPLAKRGVPDVAGNADPATGYAVRVDGTDTVIGGTSAVAPLWAALVARVNQSSGSPVGLVSPRLYPRAASLNDVTQGNNGDFTASQGWDACTGLGSPSHLTPAALVAPVPITSTSPTADSSATTGATVSMPGAPAATTILPGPAPFDAKASAFYGRFVQAAYSMYEADSGNLTPEPSSDFPAGYSLLAWIQMRDFVIGATGPVFYGFIAQCASDSSRFVLAIRGTDDGIEWWDDANALSKVPFKVAGCGSVSGGFARIYDTLEVIERSTPTPNMAPRSLESAGGFSAQVASLVKRHGPALSARDSLVPATATIEITGHSLGAALATLYTVENARSDQIQSPMLCTFASPYVGDAAFAAAFNSLALTAWRIVNIRDLVPKVPGTLLGFAHVATEFTFDSRGRVQSSVACWHSLSTYLNLLDATLALEPKCQLTSAAATDAQLRIPAVTQLAAPAGGPVTLNFTINIGG